MRKFGNLLLFFIVIMLTGVLMNSCGKSEDPIKGEAYLECKLNGKLHKFNSVTNANDPPAEETVHFVVVAGFENDDVVKAPSFGITLVSEENITEGIYHVEGGSSPELDADYCLQIYEGENFVETKCYSGGRLSDTHFSLNITSLDDWGVKGTFSGRLRDVDDKIIEVTEGKFSAPYNINL
ncbi:hypothetical protein [Sphingobacterium endophyticum]|uniref:hypothetical protein n=1 Tax=Sphingobacterium endophyticum TaxID=2546448 RepID=UPI001E652DD6|nr:hypothetical protein [Sphingobacterium endophyticum]